MRILFVPLAHRALMYSIVGFLVFCLCFGGTARAQKMLSGSNWRSQTIDTKIPKGTKLRVRNVETIQPTNCDGQLFPGIIDHDVVGGMGNVLAYKGEAVSMVANCTSGNEITLDLNSIATNGEHFVAETQGERESEAMAPNTIVTATSRGEVPAGSLIVFRLTVPFDAQR